MAAIIQPYEVALTSTNLSPNEVLRDMFYNLERLDGLIDDIYKKVEKRVGDEQERINQINTRVSSCKAIIDKVRANRLLQQFLVLQSSLLLRSYRLTPPYYLK